MIKVIIKENKLIKEEYTFSDKHPIIRIIRDAIKSRMKPQIIVEIPLKDLFQYKETDHKKNVGASFFYYGNIQRQKFFKVPELQKYSDVDFQKNILTKKIPVTVNISKEPSSDPAKAQIKEFTDNSIELIVNFYVNALSKYKGKDKEIDDLIAHEITHFKQKIDPLINFYGQQIYNLKDINNIKIHSIKDVSLTGTGQKPDLSKVKPSTDVEEYSVDPKEFIPNFNQLTRILFIKLKDTQKDFKNKLDNVNIDSSKLAGEYINMLLRDERFRNEIAGDNDLLYSYLKMNFLAREKEFPKKLLKTLTDKIDNYRSVQFPDYKKRKGVV